MKSFKAARIKMANDLRNDTGLRIAYNSNIAMLIHDELHKRKYKPKLKPKDRNEIAEMILELIFMS